MGRFISYTSFDHLPIDIIPVIASFDKNGNIRPLYVGIDGESYKVLSYLENRGYGNITSFNCRINDHNIEKPLLLTYHHAERVWTIPK